MYVQVLQPVEKVAWYKKTH